MSDSTDVGQAKRYLADLDELPEGKYLQYITGVFKDTKQFKIVKIRQGTTMGWVTYDAIYERPTTTIQFLRDL